MLPQIVCESATSSSGCLRCSGRLPKTAKKYCSKECHYAHVRGCTRANQSIACGNCGKPFYREPSRLRGRFCSRGCFAIAKTVPEKRMCAVCGSKKAYGSEKSCRSCFRKAHHARRMNSATPCRECGASVLKSPAQLAQTPRRLGVFCNRSCHAKFVRGANNPAYIDGRQPAIYPRGYRAARKRVVARDGECCFLCSTTSWLDVHHINRDKLDNRLTNLVTLCRLCHNHQKGTPEEVIRLSNRLYRLLSKTYGYPRRSITSRSKATTTTLQMQF